ncbi:uncharacterized protein TNCV_3912261 [Trichonephila clavipes]|nr:uncharacterized protein TNCV_3912261 [Trichonephila clavipes]
MWTDSMIALAWIKTEPHKLKTFVSNRVAEIQTLSKDCHWKHNYSRFQSEIQGDLHNGAQRINPENRVRSGFRIIPEEYFSGYENINDFLENIDNNLAYYEIPAQLACAYLKGHLKGRALDWFEVLGYRVIEDKATDYAHLKKALSELFPVVRNRQIRGSSEGFRRSNPNENNRFNNRHRQEKWRENRNNERYANNSRPQSEFNRFENQGFANNRRFEGRHQGGQSDQRFHNQGGRQSGLRNCTFRGQNEQSRHLNF